MKITEMLEKLAEKYGRQNVLVHTEHHTQVIVGKKKHDIWFAKTGLKWRMSGMQRTEWGAPERLLKQFNAWEEKKTDLAHLTSAIELCAAIDRASKIFANAKITRAIFCDAGFKNGVARIGVVLIDGEHVEAIRKPVIAVDIGMAEYMAIEEGFRLKGIHGGELMIYSDSQNAVSKWAPHRVKRISRENNKVADRLANLRSVDTGSN